MYILTLEPFWAAHTWTVLYPEDDRPPCCDGAVYGPGRCTCWQAVYDTVQADPVPPASAEQLLVQPALCGDCAFRKGSPERADPYEQERLFALADRREPFWCHEGMRRPVCWRHPDGRTLAAHPDDWHPAREGNFVYRADGKPALLCAGWAHRAIRATIGECLPLSGVVTI